MTRVLFVCLGNICRSPMAEYVMKDLVRKAGLADRFLIGSAGTSSEEAGNPVYPPARRELARHGIACEGHMARKLRRDEYDRWDLILGMDLANLRSMKFLFGGDPAGKCSLLSAHARPPLRHTEIADPWYNGHFDATWADVLAGCTGLLAELTEAP